MTMTAEIIERLKNEHGCSTPYQVGKKLKMTPTAAYRWVKEGTSMDDQAGMRAAKILGLDPAYVILRLHADRCRSVTVRRLIERAADCILCKIPGKILAWFMQNRRKTVNNYGCMDYAAGVT